MKGTPSQNPLRLVFWELTARCNLRCRHCRAEAGAVAAGELSLDEIRKVARSIRETGDPILVLTGGEPLTRTDFFEVAGVCTGLFSRVALATNGTLVDDALARRIADTGIQRVSVSLDGATASTHDALRGLPGSYAAAWRGYDALARAGVSRQINMTVTRQNIDEVDALLQLALENRADAFHVFALVPVGCGAEISAEARLSPERMEIFLHWLFEQSVALGDRLHIKATCVPQYYRIMREMGGVANRTLPGGHGHGLQAMTRGCLAGTAVCFISRTGDVQPCGYLPLAVGNVREQQFGDIWCEAGVFRALRDPQRLKGACGACGHQDICGGCRAQAFAATGDFLAADASCSLITPPLSAKRGGASLGGTGIWF